MSMRDCKPLHAVHGPTPALSRTKGRGRRERESRCHPAALVTPSRGRLEAHSRAHPCAARRVYNLQAAPLVLPLEADGQLELMRRARWGSVARHGGGGDTGGLLLYERVDLQIVLLLERVLEAHRPERLQNIA